MGFESTEKFECKWGKKMIKSMTGFGRCETVEEKRKCTVEIKSVNHRYLDLAIKMPKKLNFFESSIRNLLKNYIQRGKVDLYITYEDLTEQNVTINYNKEIAREYFNFFQEMANDFGIENDIKASVLSRCPEVFTMEDVEIDEESIWAILEKTITGACLNFVESREIEGENLKNDMISKLDGMLEQVDFIVKRSPKVIEEYRTRLESKVKELLADTSMDENRILTEVTIFADKACVDEELVRLKSHIQVFKDSLIAGGSVGRKLDFIAQEMNREANTTLSKSNDIEISNAAIDLKTEIEKIREQIQNIE